MIYRLNELFPSSPIMDIQLYLDFLNEQVGGKKAKKREGTILAQFFPELDLTFYLPLKRVLDHEIYELLAKSGLGIEDLEDYRIPHEASHAFLETTGAGIQRVLLEDWQIQEFHKAMRIVSGSMTEESVSLLRASKMNIQEFKTIQEMLHSRTIELNEAFANFCVVMSCEKEKKTVFTRLVENDLRRHDSELAEQHPGKQGKSLQLWKELFWIYRNFGLQTVIDTVKFALNVPIYTSYYISKFGNLFAGINPRARFDLARRALEKEGSLAAKEIAEEATQSALKIKDEMSKLEKEKILRFILGGEEVALISPVYIIMCNLEEKLVFDLPLKEPLRSSSMIIEEAPPGYIKEARKGETKRRLYHWFEGDLVLLQREDVSYTQRISAALETLLLLSVLKDQVLSGEVHCLKRSFSSCQTKHVGRYDDGVDKFKLLKCTECQAYKLVENARKIMEIWSVL